MHVERRAVIDVGTNSIKLLVADLSGRVVRPVSEQSHQTRLGEGFFRDRRLKAGPIARTAEAVARFARTARTLGAESIRVVATSAAREALNGEELIAAITRASGLPVEVISGEQEADWAFQGVTTDPALAADPLLLLDVGGGSTEFILGQGGHTDFRESFPLGTVRLLEQMPHSDPPTEAEQAACLGWLQTYLTETVQPRLEPAMRRETRLHPRHGQVRLVGTGGTATILGAMEARLEAFDRERIEAARLSREQVRRRCEQLWSLPLAQRRLLPGLPPNRADVILTGVAIYEAVMERFGFQELKVSTRGLRFAALLNPVAVSPSVDP
jgi:exopolyphosphatase/guanosine-5'-triphosphate,3'-diphosphate pyrophosphatase